MKLFALVIPWDKILSILHFNFRVLLWVFIYFLLKKTTGRIRDWKQKDRTSELELIFMRAIRTKNFSTSTNFPFSFSFSNWYTKRKKKVKMFNLKIFSRNSSHIRNIYTDRKKNWSNSFFFFSPPAERNMMKIFKMHTEIFLDG